MTDRCRSASRSWTTTPSSATGPRRCSRSQPGIDDRWHGRLARRGAGPSRDGSKPTSCCWTSGSGRRAGSACWRGRTPCRPTRPAIIVLTAYDYPQYAEAALRLGAAGFVLKTAPMADLLDAIRRAADGGLAFGVRPDASARARLSRARARGRRAWSSRAGRTTRSGSRWGSARRRWRRTWPACSSGSASPRARSSRRGPSARAGWTCHRTECHPRPATDFARNVAAVSGQWTPWVRRVAPPATRSRGQRRPGGRRRSRTRRGPGRAPSPSPGGSRRASEATADAALAAAAAIAGSRSTISTPSSTASRWTSSSPWRDDARIVSITPTRLVAMRVASTNHRWTSPATRSRPPPASRGPMRRRTRPRSSIVLVAHLLEDLAQRPAREGGWIGRFRRLPVAGVDRARLRSSGR